MNVRLSHLSFVLVVAVQSFLEDGDDLRQHALSKLPDQVAQGSGRHLPLVVVGAGQAAQQQVEQRGQNLPQSFGVLVTITFHMCSADWRTISATSLRPM